VRGATFMGPASFTIPEVSRFIDHFVGAFLLDKASRLHEQKGQRGSGHGTDRDPIASFGICFWIDGREQT
jgi:hypothetical protein